MSSPPPTPHLLVTAGPTREMIDAVRDWGNIFSGQTGLDLAVEFLQVGSVTLLTSNPEHARNYNGYTTGPNTLTTKLFRSHSDLKTLLSDHMNGTLPVDVVAMTAAVADYAPAGVYRLVSRKPSSNQEIWVVERVDAGVGQGKVKSTLGEIAIFGQRTEKLIDMFRNPWNYKGLLIKFKLEVGLSDADLLRVAAASRTASGADLMVANTLAMARPTACEGSAYIIDAQATQRVTRSALARSIKKWVQEHLKK